MNNGKYHTEEYKRKQAEKTDRLYGPIIDHQKFCIKCNTSFTFTGRIKTKKYEQALFCSRSCANNRQEWWNENATGYKTIALQHHSNECQMCKFNKVVAIHHIDENKENNSPDNLIPLCPNHHEMYHSKWQDEVKSFILDWQENYRKCKQQ